MEMKTSELKPGDVFKYANGDIAMLLIKKPYDSQLNREIDSPPGTMHVLWLGYTNKDQNTNKMTCSNRHGHGHIFEWKGDKGNNAFEVERIGDVEEVVNMIITALEVFNET